MRITFIVSSLGRGGAERVTIILANYFARNGHYVNLVVYNDIFNDYKVDNEIKVCFMPKYSNKLVDVYEKNKALKYILNEQKPDYVIALSMHRFLFFGNVAGKYRCITSERNDPHQDSWIDIMMKNNLFKKAYKVVFQTEDAMRFFSKVIQGSGVIIPNPIKEDLPDPYLGEREKRIVSFCRLSRQKNIPMLLEVFSMFIKSHPEYILEIYGEGEQEVELKQLSEHLGIKDKTKFMGFEKDIHTKIMKAAMFVSTSDYEGISNSMIEAMAVGLPVVCTDCPIGGARMFISNKLNGMLSPIGDVRLFYEAICFIADNPNLAKEMGERAAKIREDLSLRIIAKEWEKLL